MVNRVLSAAFLSLIPWACSWGSLQAEPIDPSKLQWSVAALIDQSREPFNEPTPTNRPGQFYSPRDTRGMAISPDGRYLYLGYNNSIVFGNNGLPITDRQGEVRRVDLTVTGPTMFDDQYVSRVTGNRGKALAVDDVGRVYMAETNRIDVYSADLSTKLFTINGLTGAEGIALNREGGTLMLYNSDRALGTLSKRIISESGVNINSANLDTSFDGDGNLSLAPGSASLRNVEIDGSGNIWVAGRNNQTLYRVSPNGTVVDSAFIINPFDIGFNGSQVFVTHQNQRVVSIFDISQFESNTIPLFTSGLAPPWAALGIDNNGNEETGDPGLLSGIVVLPGVGFYLGNENGQTENQHSLYGVTDSYSGFDGGIFYQDVNFDDNEPILFAALPVPEPAAIFLALTALAGFAGYARSQRRRA